MRNEREMLFKRVAPYASELVNYCKSIGLDANELANLYSISQNGEQWVITDMNYPEKTPKKLSN